MQSDNFIKTAEKIVRENPEMFEALLEFERTKKLPKLSYKTRANFTIDSDLLRKFRSYCKQNGCNMSALIENFIKTKISK